MGTTPINAGLVIQLNEAGDGTTAVGFRRAISVLLQQDEPGVAKPGRLGQNHFVVTGRADMSYGVSPGGVVLTRSSQGAYIVPLHQDITVSTGNTNGINPRIDRVYVHQPDPALDGPAVDVQAIVGVASSAPAASPEVPTIPAGALELARYLVPANATRTELLTPTNIPGVVGLNVGVIPVNQGGTGASTPAGARQAIGITSGNADPSNAIGTDGDIYFKVL